MTTYRGGCHCGAIRYSCEAEPVAARHCQCSDCRRFSGSGHTSSFTVPLDSLDMTGTPKGYTYPAGSGNPLTRYFCGDCGAPVYSMSTVYPGMANLRASTLDDPSQFRPTFVVWAASGPDWDWIDPALPRYPKAKPQDQ